MTKELCKDYTFLKENIGEENTEKYFSYLLTPQKTNGLFGLLISDIISEVKVDYIALEKNFSSKFTNFLKKVIWIKLILFYPLDLKRCERVQLN